MTNDQSPFYHLPPQNLEAEESVLASCLISPKDCEEIVELLKPEHFYKSAHQKIFTAIVSLYNDKTPIDSVTLSERLQSDGHLEAVGGGAYIASLINETPVATNVQHHAKIIIDKATKRSIIQKCHEIAKSCFDDSDTAIEIVDKAQVSILELESNDTDDLPFESMNSILMETFDTLDERFLNKGKLTGIPTGFSQIDTLTWGLQDTNLIIIAARPSIGKSSLSLNIARHAAIDCSEPFPVGIFSMEMSKQELSFKFLADLAKINTQKFKSGMFSQKEWQSLASVAGRLAEAPIYIDESNGLTIHEIRRRSRQMFKQYGIQLLVIDYIQLMAGSIKENRNRELSEISTGLKNLAKELSIPVIAISQLNREVEKRNDKRPQMSDLRDSGSIEQDSDVIAFLYRDEVYNTDENNPAKGTAEVIIRKNRTGPTGTARLAFVDKFASFYELAYDDPIGY